MRCDTFNVNQSNQALQYEVQYLRDTLSKERESAEKTFQVSRCYCACRWLCPVVVSRGFPRLQELRDELAVLQRQATTAAKGDGSENQPSSIVKAWYRCDKPPSPRPAYE